MRPSPISRRQSQTQNTEPKDLSSRPAERNNTTKRKAYLADLDKINTYNDSVNPVSQGGGKRRNLRSFNPQNPQKGTVQTVQSEIAPDHGLGVEIGANDNMGKVIGSLIYSEQQPQAVSSPIDFSSQPGQGNEINVRSQEKDLSEISLEKLLITGLLDTPLGFDCSANVSKDFSLDFLGELASYYENEQPESQEAEMTMGSQEKDLSEIPLEKLSITGLLDTPLGFDCSANVSKDFSLNFLGELASYYESEQPKSQEAEMTMGSQEKDLSEIALENISITGLLDTPLGFDCPANASKDFSLGFLDELTSHYKNAVPGNQNAEMDLEGEPEANHALPSSGVGEILPGEKRMRINHDALQNLIKEKPLDLALSAQALRKAYIEIHGEESCPCLDVFDRALRKMRAEWVRANPGQPKLWPELIKVDDRETFQSFIKDKSLDLTIGGMALRKAYIKIHGEESCPHKSIFHRALKKMRAEWVRKNPGQSTPWLERQSR